MPTLPPRTNTAHSRDGIDAPRAQAVRPSQVRSTRMRRLSIGIVTAAVVAAPVAAVAAGTTTTGSGTTPTAPAVVKSPFAEDRASSLPVGLVPDDVSKPLTYPDTPIVLSWSPVPDAASYKVEVSSNAAFTDVKFSKETDQPNVAPDILLPDGNYWWRVTAKDAAGTVGLTSSAARFAKSWPAKISGMKAAQTPGGAAVTQVDHQPYLTWGGLPGATEYEFQIAPADQFGTPAFSVIHDHTTFGSPAPWAVLPDDSYQWRVRARDPKGNPGPWSTPGAFTKSWYQAVPAAPADGAAVDELFFQWNAVPGAEAYQVQVSNTQFTWEGSAVEVNAQTFNTSYGPSFDDIVTKGIVPGVKYWRVRPIVNGIYGGWSIPRTLTWALPSTTTPTPVLQTAVDSDTALMPELHWSAATGATIYRVDVATDQLFHNVVFSDLTSQHSYTFRNPLPDNQVTSGYWWRVVWGTGTKANPQWQVDESLAPTGSFKKQTRVTLGLASGTQVTEAPLLTWSGVPGAARYELQLSQNPLFDKDVLGGAEVDSATIWGLGVVPGMQKTDAKRLTDGTWYWRVRAVDGLAAGQTWSPTGSFTLTQPRPTISEPGDGDTVIAVPVMKWSAVAQACGYDVQVGEKPSIADDAQMYQTAQSALVLTSKEVTTPGRYYWRVRADYCNENKGQWSPTRSFKSVRPPDFGLNSVPSKVDFGGHTIVSGALKFGGARVQKPTLVLERRVWPERDYRFFGTVKGDQAGRFAFRLKNTRTAAYRLVWAADDNHPEGQAPFALQVLPRIAFSLGGHKVVRHGKVMVRGSVYPARKAVIQTKTSGGWETVRTLKLKSSRFSFPMKATLIAGQHTLRLIVPGDQKLSTARSKQRRLFVYDKFVIRGAKNK